ncbi:hypothetical protein PR048_015693 [Dryococelus australis]|uniref:Integrase catalytic domain-containing protein n=1 Tax=Dryococelus australis TaxID=614101 RepID=A0ABQ9HIQ4_9NEOP|nr:hypothetical protein PR048_015693 [Dryococelus australis]
MQCLPDKYLELVKDARRTKDMLKSLEEVFERQTMKFKPKEKLEHNFLRCFQGLVPDMENAGAKLDDRDKICHLFLTLGDNFNAVITAIETMKQDLTMEFVKCRLLEEEIKRGQKCQETPSSNEVSFKIRYYGCGKVDHKRQDSWHNKQRTGKRKGAERKPFKRNETPGGPRADISFTAFSCEVMSKDNIFILDLGATNHSVGSLEEYKSEIRTLPHSVVIKTTNGGEMIATGAGKFMGDYSSGVISFEGLIVPGLINNLKEKVTIRGGNFYVECEKGHFNLFLLKLNPVTKKTLCTLLLARNLGELSPQYLEGKAKRFHFKKNKKSTQSIRELLHSDVSGPVKTATKEGERYFQVIDDFSHFTTVNLLKTKSEAKQNMMNSIKMVKTQHGVKSKELLDSGGESSSNSFKISVLVKGSLLSTPPHTLLNRILKAERMNLTLMNKVRTKFAETYLPRILWGEASAYKLNRSSTSALLNRTPASVWFGENDSSKLRVFGSQAYMLKLPRESKLESFLKPTIMVGYSYGGNRLWDPLKDKIVSSRDVTFSESKKIWYRSKTDTEENGTKEVTKHGTPQQYSKESDEKLIGFEDPDEENNKRSKPNRTTKKPSHL